MKSDAQPQFYQDRICLNVLVNSRENAKAIYEAVEGHVVVGLLAKNYMNIESAIVDMQAYMIDLDGAVSVGLGAGDPSQSETVGSIAQAVMPAHVNQVFTGVGFTRGRSKNPVNIINALVSPCGRPGYVNLATGALSAQSEPAIVPVETAIAMIKDMGGQSIKYFPMQGLATREEYIAVAKACAKLDFILEPTGGLDLNNVEAILQIALDAGVQQLIPHVYTSIIDPQTGATRLEDVKQLYAIMKKLVG